MQAIIATALAKGDYKLAETAAFRILQVANFQQVQYSLDHASGI
jgi:hypothetical protein